MTPSGAYSVTSRRGRVSRYAIPSLWSAASVAGRTALASAAISVIGLSLLPLAPLQAEPRHQDGRQQERDHGGGYGRALAQAVAEDAALVAERGHQVRGVDRA